MPMERKIVTISGQWLGLPTINLTEDQQKALQFRLQDYMNSDAFLEGVVPVSQLELGVASTTRREEDAEEIIRGLRIAGHPVAGAFSARLSGIRRTN